LADTALGATVVELADPDAVAPVVVLATALEAGAEALAEPEALADADVLAVGVKTRVVPGVRFQSLVNM
jgi:hypothetical protein